VTKGKHDEIEEDYKQEEEVLEEGGQVWKFDEKGLFY
jgi:hypothetical protein